MSFENSSQNQEQASADELTLVDEVKVELNDIDSSDLSEHSARFEALHGKLQEALSTIDGL
ncbi:unannotated protein [freshwater metagenome]|uniref:Unannotated protein n=1 Tax=freshwater metagenome TaxID=449393 RepID=A0A6J6JS54_9ZZZZ|nr:hypothetical protein [Actinomycetota bacterium]